MKKLIFLFILIPLMAYSIVYHGNRNTKKFHKPSCTYYDCPNCTKIFYSYSSAINADYVPCKVCNPSSLDDISGSENSYIEYPTGNSDSEYHYDYSDTEDNSSDIDNESEIEYTSLDELKKIVEELYDEKEENNKGMKLGIFEWIVIIVLGIVLIRVFRRKR